MRAYDKMEEDAKANGQEILILQQQVRDFLAQDLFVSAELMCGLVLCRSRSLASRNGGESATHTESLELYGDALFGKNEFKRALTYYRQAETHRKLHGGSTSPRKNMSSSPSYPSSTTPDAEIRLKEAKCHLKLGDANQALRALVAISPKHRSLPIWLTLGQIYWKLDLNKDAIHAYKMALGVSPLALEAVIALAQLGLKKDDIWATATDGTGVQVLFARAGEVVGEVASTVMKDVIWPWLENFICAHVAVQTQRDMEGVQRFTELEKRFPGNSHCLLHKARLHIEQDQLVDAQTTFAKALENDSQVMEFMDYYAVLLRQKAAGTALNSLAHKLMAIDNKRPEAWIAVSLHSDMRGEKDRALTFIDKALQVAPSHVLAYHVKGTLLLSLGRAEPAASAFLQASALHKDIYSFKGLVDSYLALHKYKEALCMAKEALSKVPKNAKAITLVGRVLAHLPEGRDKAKRAFQRALSIDPLTMDAILALADLYIASGEYDRCIDLLRQSLENSSHDFLHTKLGEVYTLNEEYAEALACFHTAISSNPTSVAAANGLERLEKLMRGVDPDAEDDEADMEGVMND